MCGGPSQSEVNAANLASSESQQLYNDFVQQFGEEQMQITGLAKQLQGMFTNPTGFGAKALADMDAQLQNSVESQWQSAKTQANQQFATNNLAGLPSGVQQAVNASLASSAGGQLAQGTTQISLANEGAKLQQQAQAEQNLMAIPGMYAQAPQTGQWLTSSTQNAFNLQNQVNQQGAFWSNLGEGLLGSAIGGGLDFLTGGLTGLAPGGAGFLSGGLSALGMGGGRSGGSGSGFTFPAGTVSALGGYTG